MGIDKPDGMHHNDAREHDPDVLLSPIRYSRNVVKRHGWVHTTHLTHQYDLD